MGSNSSTLMPLLEEQFMAVMAGDPTDEELVEIAEEKRRKSREATENAAKKTFKVTGGNMEKTSLKDDELRDTDENADETTDKENSDSDNDGNIF